MTRPRRVLRVRTATCSTGWRSGRVEPHRGQSGPSPSVRTRASNEHPQSGQQKSKKRMTTRQHGTTVMSLTGHFDRISTPVFVTWITSSILTP